MVEICQPSKIINKLAWPLFERARGGNLPIFSLPLFYRNTSQGGKLPTSSDTYCSINGVGILFVIKAPPSNYFARHHRPSASVRQANRCYTVYLQYTNNSSIQLCTDKMSQHCLLGFETCEKCERSSVIKLKYKEYRIVRLKFQEQC